MCVCIQISSLKPPGHLKPNFMWNLHGIGEGMLFKWFRSFGVFHYCQPPGAGAFSRDFTIKFVPAVQAGHTNDWCISQAQMRYGKFC